MPRIFDFGGRGVERSLTVAGLRALEGQGRVARAAETADEAARCRGGGHRDGGVPRGQHCATVRDGSKKVFATAALGFADAVTGDEVLRTAFGHCGRGRCGHHRARLGHW